MLAIDAHLSLACDPLTFWKKGNSEENLGKCRGNLRDKTRRLPWWKSTRLFCYLYNELK